MADAISFQLRLIDKMSAPLKKIAAQVTVLTTGLETLRSVAEQAESAVDKIQAKLAKPVKAPALPKSVAPKAAGGEGGPKTPAPVEAPELKMIQLTSKQLQVLKQRLQEDKLAVTNLSASLRALKAAEVPNIAAIAAVNKQLKQRQNSIAEVQAKLVASGHAAKFGSEGTNRLTATLKKLVEAAGQGGLTRLPQVLSSVRGVAATLASPIGAAGLALGALAGAAIAATAAVVGLVAGFTALAIAGARLALSASEAKADTRITLEALLGSAGAADRLSKGIYALTQEVAITSDKANALVKSLAAAGLKNTSTLLGTAKAIGQAESVVEGAGQKLEAVIQRAMVPKAWLTPMGVQLRQVFQIQPEDLQGTGLTIQEFYRELGGRIGKGVAEVRFALAMGRISAEEGTKALNAAITKKFGGAAEKKMLLLSNQVQRFRQNFKALFKDVDTSGFMKSIKAMVDIFDQSTVMGKVLHGILTNTFNGLFATLERLAPFAKVFFKGLIILAFQVYLGFRPLLKQLGMFGDGKGSQESLIKRMDELGVAANTAARWTGKLVGALLDLSALAPVFSNLAKAALGPLATISASFFGILGSLTQLGIKLLAMVPEWQKAGGEMVDGLVKGIKAASSRAVNAVKGMAGDALKAFKSVFKIASPSKVMFGMGANLSASAGMGIKARAPDAQRALARVIPFPTQRPPTAATPPRAREYPVGPSSGRSGARSGAGITLHLEAGAVVISGIADAKDLKEQFPSMMADALERFAESQGVDRESA